MDRTKKINVPSRKVWPGMDQMISDYTALEQSIRGMRNVLAVIAYQQDDHILTVPVSALRELPKGCELEVSFDRVHDCYHFIVMHPEGIVAGERASDLTAAAEGASLSTDDHVPG